MIFFLLKIAVFLVKNGPFFRAKNHQIFQFLAQKIAPKPPIFGPFSEVPGKRKLFVFRAFSKNGPKMGFLRSERPGKTMIFDQNRRFLTVFWGNKVFMLKIAQTLENPEKSTFSRSGGKIS